MNTPASCNKELSSSGVVEAEKVRGALTLLFRLDKANTAARKAEERRIRESKDLIQTINSILEKRLG